MKKSPFASFFLSIAGMLMISLTSHADFGEIDLIIRESIEIHFSEYNQSVDLHKLEYIGNPKVQDSIMIVRSSVWAEQGLIAPWWGWYECTTDILIKEDGHYSDQGSYCYFEWD